MSDTAPAPSVILTLRRDIAEILPLVQWIEAHCVAAGVTNMVNSIMQMVIEEAVTNLILHSLPEDSELDIELHWLMPDPSTICIEIIDSGEPFNPLERPDPDITLSAEDRDIGGLGIHLVRRYMDQCNYERRDHRNVLALTRRLNP